MGKIYINTDIDAPCCPCEIVDEATGRSFLAQTDWDYPGIATTFGWSVQEVQRNDAACGECEHVYTDGTIDCPDCGVPARAFIAAAGDWLGRHNGTEADDPGYFDAH